MDRIIFEPPLPMANVVNAASSADIGMIPYRANSLNNRFATPNKLFEYMSAGLALAVSDFAGAEAHRRDGTDRTNLRCR